jgi:DNA-binding response OmpR family regulator
MPSILTVDDSRAVRMIVSKQVRQFGFDVSEAEDGEQALALLAEAKFDLVVLDVTMPVMDGPTMLAALRERGDQTPVLMLTSESKRSIVANLMKIGISDYILKPFKPEELQAKILKILKVDAAAGAGAARSDDVAAAAPAPDAGGTAGAVKSDGSKPFCDILVIDDMENVAKRFRQLIPDHLTMASALNGQSALALCRERVFRVVLIDSEMPDVDTASLSKSVRVLQPNAAFALLSLRTTNNVQAEARKIGIDTVVFKPFTSEGVEEFLLKYFDNQELVAKEDNVLRVAPFKGREERLPGYFLRVSSLVAKSVEEIASACFAEVVLDISRAPVTPANTAQLLIDLGERTKKMGLELRLVGSTEVKAALKQYAETATMTVFQSVEDARAAA